MKRKLLLSAAMAIGALSLIGCDLKGPTETIKPTNDPAPIEHKFKENVQYKVLEQPIKYVNNQVTEFFWYGCPHCYAAEPVVNQWESDHKNTHSLNKVHSQLSERWMLDANVFFGLKNINRLDISKDYFDARQNNQFKQTEDINKWLESNSIDSAAFFTNLNNPEIIKEREGLLGAERNINAGGVPTFIVEGKYLVLIKGISEIGGWKGLPELFNYLSSLDGK